MLNALFFRRIAKMEGIKSRLNEIESPRSRLYFENCLVGMIQCCLEHVMVMQLKIYMAEGLVQEKFRIFYPRKGCKGIFIGFKFTVVPIELI
jgi:hypothetical protein